MSASISIAHPGDTVIVPAGTATWASGLDIHKGIILKGAGIGNTIIIRGSGASYILNYYPSDYNSDHSFRVTGFSFDGNAGFIMDLGENSKSAPFLIQTRVRIDHNRFYSSASVNNSSQALTYRGTYGLVDNNTFDNYPYPCRNVNTAGNSSWWDSYATAGFRYIVGDKYNIYFEDNTFNLGTAGVQNYNCVTDSQYSGRYVFRYNTINQTWQSMPLFDLHGNGKQSAAGMCSSFGGEIHDNIINANGFYTELTDDRGGQMLIYNNTIVNGNEPYIQIRDEYDDSVNPTVSPDPQYPNRTYYWNNLNGLGGSVLPVEMTNQINGHPIINQDYFTDDTSGGAAGMAKGPIASRPTSETVEGYGYWATDQNILYRWTSGAWVQYYTPYTYPHPLRSDPIIGD